MNAVSPTVCPTPPCTCRDQCGRNSLFCSCALAAVTDAVNAKAEMIVSKRFIMLELKWVIIELSVSCSLNKYMNFLFTFEYPPYNKYL